MLTFLSRSADEAAQGLVSPRAPSDARVPHSPSRRVLLTSTIDKVNFLCSGEMARLDWDELPQALEQRAEGVVTRLDVEMSFPKVP